MPAVTRQNHARASLVAARARALAASVPTALNLSATSGTLHPHASRPYARDDREFWQHRPYTPGDALTRIDWKRSASSDDIYIRDLQRHDDQGLTLWIDRRAGMQFKSAGAAASKFETALTLALSIDQILATNGARTTHLDAPIDPSGEMEETASIYLSLPATSTLPNPDHIKHNAPIILFTDAWDDPDALAPWINRIAARTTGIYCLQIADPAERSLPYHGRMRFNWGSNTTPLLENVDDIRADYTQRIDAHLSNLAALLAPYHGHLTTVTTTDDLRPPLHTVLRRLGSEGE